MAFRRRKASEENKNSKTEEPVSLTVNRAEDSKYAIEDSCQQIVESTLQAQEMKTELQAVTHYISDIQKIEALEREDRELINDLARKILTLSKDRERYKKGTRKIKDTQYHNLAKFEESIPLDLRKMKAWEAYSFDIENDLKYLDSERAALLHQKEDAEANQKTLGTIGITTSILSVLLFLLFIWVNLRTGANMQLPFLLTIALGATAAAYIFIRARENRKDTADAEKKLNRAIQLLNKVKIKYINNTNALDYCYQKYMVDSYAQLTYLWEEYKKEKEDENKYKVSKEQTEYYNREIITHLKTAKITDAKIWIYQLEALLDSVEMEKLTTALLDRRQKLKERIEQNNLLKEKCLEDIEKFTKEKEENKEYVAELLKKHGINL